MDAFSFPCDEFHEIEQAVPKSVSPDQFVLDAVREKLAWLDSKGEFYRLSDETRQIMLDKGLTEECILKDFESHPGPQL